MRWSSGRTSWWILILIYFFQQSPDLLCIAGYDGYFKRVNPSWQRLLGYSELELLSSPIDSFVFLDDSQETLNRRNYILKGNSLLNYENRYLSKQGKVIWLSWTSFPVPERRLIYAIAKDITVKKQLEADRNALIRQMSGSIEKMRQSNYTVSHDLRSPVNNLFALIDLLDPMNPQSSESQEFLDLIRVSLCRLKVIFDRYLTGVDNEEVSAVAMESVFVPEIFKEVVFSIDTLIVSSEARISTDFSAWETVRFSRVFMYSILLNLITNAIKYRREGVGLKIEIETMWDGKGQQMVIRDNGIGFDMDAVDRAIFGFRKKFTDLPDSNGIGLYLVSSQIRALGGDIQLTSKKGEGSAFLLTF
ncbi:PAS domain-containing sensor histidine kinase [Lunatimonas lonarensis]|uniref:PAS domain-containing sensor histidine kinase n=1 Tax=Lunatimonas lonarensis TaxID=1232681 RepID=UPI001EE224D2|nr:HAMP domain-containing sensor histidine kinase [Lunatimonas lonarensis]